MRMHNDTTAGVLVADVVGDINPCGRLVLKSIRCSIQKPEKIKLLSHSSVSVYVTHSLPDICMGLSANRVILIMQVVTYKDCSLCVGQILIFSVSHFRVETHKELFAYSDFYTGHFNIYKTVQYVKNMSSFYSFYCIRIANIIR